MRLVCSNCFQVPCPFKIQDSIFVCVRDCMAKPNLNRWSSGAQDWCWVNLNFISRAKQPVRTQSSAGRFNGMIRRFVDIELGSGLLCPGVSQTNYLKKDAIGRAPVRLYKLIEFESDH